MLEINNFLKFKLKVIQTIEASHLVSAHYVSAINKLVHSSSQKSLSKC